MQLKEDLRTISEEKFKEIYNYLEKKTSKFTAISPELILENNQYLLVLRLCSGLSQESFAKYLGTTKDWCRHTEAGRNKIKHFFKDAKTLLLSYFKCWYSPFFFHCRCVTGSVYPKIKAGFTY